MNCGNVVVYVSTVNKKSFVAAEKEPLDLCMPSVGNPQMTSVCQNGILKSAKATLILNVHC